MGLGKYCKLRFLKTGIDHRHAYKLDMIFCNQQSPV